MDCWSSYNRKADDQVQKETAMDGMRLQRLMEGAPYPYRGFEQKVYQRCGCNIWKKIKEEQMKKYESINMGHRGVGQQCGQEGLDAQRAGVPQQLQMHGIQGTA
jgi:hypothetical protein